MVAALLAVAGPGCKLTLPAEPQPDATADAAPPLDVDPGPDAALPDAAPPDAAPPDAAPPDAAPPDAAPPDAGPPPHNCQPTTGQDCSPGSGQGTADECFDGPSCYLSDVQAGVNGTISAHPEWFYWDSNIPCWIILDLDNFMDSVVAHIQGQGLCAIRDPNAPGEEVTVKHDNAFSENFDIVASTGCARSGGLIYTGYCVPAWW